MKIGFDISQTCESKTGTGFVADQLIRALAQIDQENEYTLLPWFYDYRPQTLENATRIAQKNFREKVLKRFDDSESALRELDVIHSNNYRFPKDVSARKVVTLHDVCFMDCPEYTTEANRLFCYKGTLDSMMYADKIIAVSQYTKQRLLHFFPFVDDSKVEVVYEGNRTTLLKEKDNPQLVRQFGLRENDFFLSVGTIEPRKNYSTLLKAFKLYKETTQDTKKLCIAGGYGWKEENFQQKIADLGLSEEVVVTGYVSEEQLANLYRYCFAFVYTTWYEGFGLPVLEAMNFDKPVIVSNVTSVPEIVGPSGILIHPDQEEEICAAMKRLAEDETLYQKIVAGEKERLSLFTWENTAKRVLEIYKGLV